MAGLVCPFPAVAHGKPRPCAGASSVRSMRSHAMQLEHGVDRVARWRRNAELAAEGSHFAREPIELKPVATFEIVRHGRLYPGLDFCRNKGRTFLEISGVQRHALGFTDGKCLIHQRAKKSAQFGICYNRT